MQPSVAGVARNEPCSCGSGLRYKLCHGRIALHPGIVGFVVAGTQKGGTSALESYLREHPEICMPANEKEVHYFDSDARFIGDDHDYSAYHAHFAPRPSHRLLGDATPMYMYHPAVPERIRRYNPQMKFIMLLRDPVSRAYSHWNMEIRKKHETLRFEEAVRTEAARRSESTASQIRRRAYKGRGRYSEQLQRIWSLFPREQTLALRSDRFQADPAPTLAEIASFLGVGAFPRVDRRTVYHLPYEEPMSATARSYLQQEFASEIDTLEQMLGWDLSDWREAR